jgi:hypothetical protein
MPFETTFPKNSAAFSSQPASATVVSGRFDTSRLTCPAGRPASRESRGAVARDHRRLRWAPATGIRAGYHRSAARGRDRGAARGGYRGAAEHDPPRGGELPGQPVRGVDSGDRADRDPRPGSGLRSGGGSAWRRLLRHLRRAAPARRRLERGLRAGPRHHYHLGLAAAARGRDYCRSGKDAPRCPITRRSASPWWRTTRAAPRG